MEYNKDLSRIEAEKIIEKNKLLAENTNLLPENQENEG